MLRLQDMTFIKIMVFAIGIASILLFAFSLLGWFNIDYLSVKTTNLGVVIGGLLFGIGFGTVGTCVIAAGSGGAKKTVSAVVGGLLVAWFFSITYQFWIDIGLYDIMNLDKLTLFNISDNYPALFSISFTGLLIVGLLF